MLRDNVAKILSLTQSEDYLENPKKQAKVKEYEHQINQFVYKLYDLTDEEIKIVEGETYLLFHLRSGGGKAIEFQDFLLPHFFHFVGGII